MFSRFFNVVTLFVGALFTPLPAYSATVSLPTDFAETQGVSGLYYEAYLDNRPTNSGSNGTSSAQLLAFVGTQSFGNGSIVNSGPAYWFPGSYPYVTLDTARNVFLMHPGARLSQTDPSSFAACVNVTTSGGLFQVTGAFARGNNFQLAGDGVDVGIFRDTAAGTPLFASTISSDHAVDTNSYFTGTGVSEFDFTVALSPNEPLRFAVFSGPNGADGGFDATAFRVSVRAVPEPNSLIIVGVATLCIRRIRRSRNLKHDSANKGAAENRPGGAARVRLTCSPQVPPASPPRSAVPPRSLSLSRWYPPNFTIKNPSEMTPHEQYPNSQTT